MDLPVGKYKTVKMAIVQLRNERDMYLNFNTESTALCLESLGQLWNLVVLELTETETNFEAGYKDIDHMEETKIPIKIVSVLRRNMGVETKKNTNSSVTQNSGGSALSSEISNQMNDFTHGELMEVYQFVMQIKARRIPSISISNLLWIMSVEKYKSFSLNL